MDVLNAVRPGLSSSLLAVRGRLGYALHIGNQPLACLQSVQFGGVAEIEKVSPHVSCATVTHSWPVTYRRFQIGGRWTDCCVLLSLAMIA